MSTGADVELQDLSTSVPDSLQPLQECDTERLPDSKRAVEKRHVRFGDFELRTDTHELTRRGIRIRLQTKPARILEMLVSRPSELVSREELRNWLWPGNIFVDFEGGLNTAMNRLRAVLSDTAEKPLYIETVPRLGYRFICPVQEVAERVTGSNSFACADQFDTVADECKYACGAVAGNMFWRLTLAVVLAWTCQFLFFYLHPSGTGPLMHACFLN